MKLIIAILLVSNVGFAADCISEGTSFASVMKTKGLGVINPKVKTKMFSKATKRMSKFRNNNCTARTTDIYDNCVSQCATLTLRDMDSMDYRPECRKMCSLQKLVIEKARAEKAVKICEGKLKAITQIERDIRKSNSANQ